jgi:hypothetical protein
MRLVSSICRLLLVVQLLRSCADSSMTWSTAQTAATHAHVFMLHTSSQLPHLTRFIPGRLPSFPYAQRFVEAVCAAARQSRCVFCATCSRHTACPHHTCATNQPACWAIAAACCIPLSWSRCPFTCSTNLHGKSTATGRQQHSSQTGLAGCQTQRQ